MKTMASIKEIIEIEKSRSESKDIYTIHMYKEGMFFHLYDWSAWLFSIYIQSYKVTHRTANGLDDSFVMVGFPPTKLDSLIPEGADVVTVGEKAMDIILPEEMLGEEVKSLEDLTAEYEQWKASFPVEESAKKKKEAYRESMTSKKSTSGGMTNFAMGIMSMNQELLRMIFSFQPDEHTPSEAYTFVKELQRYATNVIIR